MSHATTTTRIIGIAGYCNYDLLYNSIYYSDAEGDRIRKKLLTDLIDGLRPSFVPIYYYNIISTVYFCEVHFEWLNLNLPSDQSFSFIVNGSSMMILY